MVKNKMAAKKTTKNEYGIVKLSDASSIHVSSFQMFSVLYKLDSSSQMFLLISQSEQH